MQKKNSESIHLSGAATRRVLNPGKGSEEQQIVHKFSRHSTDVASPKRRCRSRGKAGNILDITDSQKRSMAPLEERLQTAEAISSRKGESNEPSIQAIEDHNDIDKEIEENQINCRKWDLIEIPAVDPKEDTGEPTFNNDQDGEMLFVENANELAVDPKEDMGEPIINNDTDDEMFSVEVANEVELALGEAGEPTLGTIQEAQRLSNNIDRERESKDAEESTLGTIQEAQSPSNNIDLEREPIEAEEPTLGTTQEAESSSNNIDRESEPKDVEEPTLSTIQEAESPSNNIGREREPKEAEDPILGMIQEAENPSDNIDQEREPRAEYEFHVALEMRTSSNEDDGDNDDDYRDLTNEDHRPASNDERTI